MLKNYTKDRNKVIRQINITKIDYDNEYVDQRYNSYPTGEAMAYLRLGYLLGVLNEFKPTKILDIGYGNGDFLKAASKSINFCCGSDIEPMYPLPDYIETVQDIYKDEYDVVCFFDSLEHFDNIYEISKLRAKYIYISVPECHYFSDEWFNSWKHRRENEHLWHFNLESLTLFFAEMGYEIINYSDVEDIIRTAQEDGVSNILSAIFRKI